MSTSLRVSQNALGGVKNRRISHINNSAVGTWLVMPIGGRTFKLNGTKEVPDFLFFAVKVFCDAIYATMWEAVLEPPQFVECNIHWRDILVRKLGSRTQLYLLNN